MTEIEEQRAPKQRSWKKIGGISGGVFAVLMVIGAVAGDPPEQTVAIEEAADSDEATTTEAPTTSEAPATTEAPTTTAAPTTTGAPTTTAAPTTTTTAPPPPTTTPAPQLTTGQQQALGAAHDYFDVGMHFSYQGLIDQLSSAYGNQFSVADATYAADNVGADWNEQAAGAAQDYLDTGMHFSRQGMIDQLSSPYGNQFTTAQAEYGATAVGL